MTVLGVRAHDFGRASAPELADRIAAAGFNAVQLAPSKALAGLEAGSLPSPAEARKIGLAFASRGIEIAVLGSYINPVFPEPGFRATELERFKRALSLAGEMGAGMVATETGATGPGGRAWAGDSGEEAFKLLAGSVEILLEEAEAQGAVMALEAAQGHVAPSSLRMARLLALFPSPSLRLVLDPANLVGPGMAGKASAIVAEALALLGPRTEALHAKDVVELEGQRKVVGAFSGCLDYGSIHAWAEGLPRKLWVLFEDGSPQVLAAARDAWLARGRS